MNRRIVGLTLGIGLTCICLFHSLSAFAQEIWFGPTGPGAGKVHAIDFMNLFAPDTPWQRSASRVKVFIIHGTYGTQ